MNKYFVDEIIKIAALSSVISNVSKVVRDRGVSLGSHLKSLGRRPHRPSPVPRVSAPSTKNMVIPSPTVHSAASVPGTTSLPGLERLRGGAPMLPKPTPVPRKSISDMVPKAVLERGLSSTNLGKLPRRYPPT